MANKDSYKTEVYKNIRVSYLPVLAGGGRGFGQEFIRVVKEKIGKVDHVFEFCAGPGFIGFSLLAQGLCNKLTLADINPNAVQVCRDTIVKNGLADRVSVYVSDCLDSIPETERWDLVVSNPPHWPDTYEKYKGSIATYDPEFTIHRKFYRDIAKFLKPNGIVLMQENGRATQYEDFIPMIRDSGLETVDVFKARVLTFWECLMQGGRMGKDTRESSFYFIQAKRRKE